MKRPGSFTTGLQQLRQWVAQRAQRSFPTSRRPRIPAATGWFQIIEPLEPRQLLTTTILYESFDTPYQHLEGWTVASSFPASNTAYWGAVDANFGGEGTHSGNGKAYTDWFGFTGAVENPSYRPNSSSYLSRTIDLTGLTAATLEFWFKIPSIDQSLFGCDYAQVYIDSTLIWQSNSTATQWTRQAISLDAFVGGSHTLKFEFKTDETKNGEGWYLDDLLVTDQPTPPDPDNTLAKAVNLGTILPGDSVSRLGQSLDFNDVDMVAFTVGARQTLGFDIDRSENTNFYSQLRLYNAAGTRLATNAGALGPSPDSAADDPYLEYTFQDGGTYYLGISGVDLHGTFNPTIGVVTNPSIHLGEYDLIISNRVDPDDTILEAANVGFIPYGGSVHYEDQSIEFRDVDMISFAVSAGQTLGFDLDVYGESTPILLKTMIRLFNPSGVEMATSFLGAGPAPEPDMNAYLQYTFPSSGTYFLGISGGENRSYDANTGGDDLMSGYTGPYDLIITDRPQDADDSLAEAFYLGAIPRDGVFTLDDQSIDLGSDVDMVAFSVAAGQTIGFDIDRSTGSSLLSRLRLFSHLGVELASNQKSTGPLPEPSDSDPYLIYTFNTAGVYFLGVSSQGNILYNPSSGVGDVSGVTAGGYDLIISDRNDPDPDDTITQASSLGLIPPVGSILLSGQAIDTAEDVDMFSFTVAAGQILQFDIDGSQEGELNSLLKLYNSAGTLLASNNNAAGPLPETSSLDSYLEFDFLSGGLYFLAVSNSENTLYSPIHGADDDSDGSTGGYDLTITSPGDTDPDDSIDQALDLGVIQSEGLIALTGRSIDAPTDVDMVAFTVAAGQTIDFDIDTDTQGQLNSRLRLFNASGTLLNSNDDGMGPSPELNWDDSHLRYTFAVDGVYYLGVSSDANQNYNPLTGKGDSGQGTGGEYDLIITDIPVEFGGKISIAYPMGAIPINGSISRSDQSIVQKDVDMISFTVLAGQTVSFDIDNPAGGSLASHLKLFDCAGTLLASNANGQGPTPESFAGESFLRYTFTLSGTYYLGVSAQGNDMYDPLTGSWVMNSPTTGDYDLFITSVTQIDPGATLATARSIGALAPNASTSQTAQIITQMDVDMISFTVLAGQIVSFDIDNPAGSALASHLRLFSGDGTPLASNGNGQGPAPESFAGESFLQYTFAVAGTYYLGISAQGNDKYGPGTGDWLMNSPTVGEYDLFITSEISLDPGATVATAHSLGALAPDVPIARTAQIITQRDVDLFSFTVAAGQVVSFDIDNSAGGSLSSYLRLFTENGIMLASNEGGGGPAPEPSEHESSLLYTFSAAGTYYLGVSAQGNGMYSAITGSRVSDTATTGGYDLIITSQIIVDDDNSLTLARNLGTIPLNGSATLPGQSIDPGDVDIVAFTVAAGQTLRFDIDNSPGSSLLSHLKLFATYGVLLTFNEDGDGPAPEPFAQESYLQYTFANAGTYYLAISAQDNTTYETSGGGSISYTSSTGHYDLIISDHAAQAEPDDMIATAYSMGSISLLEAASRTGQSIGQSDVDIVAFTVVAGQTLGFDIDNTVGSSLVSGLKLFTGDGTPLAANEHGNGPAPEIFADESYLQYTFTTAGTYYLAVSAKGNGLYNPITGGSVSDTATTGGYDLIITNDPAPLLPDNTIATAYDLGTIPLNGSASRTGQSIGQRDLDIVAFTVAAGQTLGFDVDNIPGSSLISYLKLFTASGNLLTTNEYADGPSPEPFENEAYFQYTFYIPGVYYLGVSAQGNGMYSPTNGSWTSVTPTTGGYDLYITTQTPTDTDNTIASAYDLGVIPAQGSISRSGQTIEQRDVDLFAFTVTAGQSLNFDIDNPGGGSLSSNLRLFNASGNELASNDGGHGPAPEPHGQESYLQYTFTAAGTYYLGVAALGNDSYRPTGGGFISDTPTTGDYELVVTSEIIIDTDDTLAEAHPLGAIPPNGSSSRIGQTIGQRDVDIVSFSVVAGQTLSLDIDNSEGGSLVSYMRLFNAAGTLLNFNQGGLGLLPEPSEHESSLLYTFSAAGTYYLGVSAQGNGKYFPTGGGWISDTQTTGDYALIITDIPADLDNTFTRAHSLGAIPHNAAASVTGQSIGRMDVDLFSFSVISGQTLSFDIDNPAGGTLVSHMRLFNSAGDLLTFNEYGNGPTPELFADESFLRYTFNATGTYYLGISAKGNGSYSPTHGSGVFDTLTTGDYGLFISSDNLAEPGGSIGTSYNLGTIPLSGSISRTGQSIGQQDVDMLAFTVAAGQVVGFDIDNPAGSSLVSYLRLFDSSGNALTSNENGDGPGLEIFTGESYLQYTFTTAGTYYLGVSAQGNGIYSPTSGSWISDTPTTGAYELYISNPFVENDGVIAQAPVYGSIPAGGSFSRTGQSIDWAMDVDIIAFSAAAGQTLGFDIDRTADSSLASHLRLFDSAGVELAYSTRYRGPSPEPSSYEPYIEYTFPAAGTYHLGISAYGNGLYSATDGTGLTMGTFTGGYNLIVTDRFDPDDTIAKAVDLSIIRPGDRILRANQVIGYNDVDMMAFTATEGLIARFDIDRTPASELDTTLKLFDASGTMLAMSVLVTGPLPEPSTRDPYLEYVFPIGGVYYLGVASSSNWSYSPITGAGDNGNTIDGGYDLIISGHSPDSDDAITEAVDLGAVSLQNPLQITNRTIEFMDVDLVAITVAMGQSLSFDINTPAYGGLDAHLRLFDANGVELASNNHEPGYVLVHPYTDPYLEYSFYDAGTYYLGISSSGNNRYNAATGAGDADPNSAGAYNLIVTDLTADFNRNGRRDAQDIDLLCITLAADDFHPLYDLNCDGDFTQEDVDHLVISILDSDYGDANLDCATDQQDLSIVGTYYGRTGGWDCGDFNGDFKISLGDLVLLAENYTPESELQITPSPEHPGHTGTPGTPGNPATNSGLQALTQPWDDSPDDSGMEDPPAENTNPADILAELADALRD